MHDYGDIHRCVEEMLCNVPPIRIKIRAIIVQVRLLDKPCSQCNKIATFLKHSCCYSNMCRKWMIPVRKPTVWVTLLRDLHGICQNIRQSQLLHAIELYQRDIEIFRGREELSGHCGVHQQFTMYQCCSKSPLLESQVKSSQKYSSRESSQVKSKVLESRVKSSQVKSTRVASQVKSSQVT